MSRAAHIRDAARSSPLVALRLPCRVGDPHGPPPNKTLRPHLTAAQRAVMEALSKTHDVGDQRPTSTGRRGRSLIARTASER